MTTQLTFEEAVTLLRKFVKFSAVKGQKHIDLNLAAAEMKPLLMKALMVTKEAVNKGEIAEDKLKEKLGLE